MRKNRVRPTTISRGIRRARGLNLVLFYGPLQRTTGNGGGSDGQNAREIYIYSSRALLYMAHIDILCTMIFVIISKRLVVIAHIIIHTRAAAAVPYHI